MTMMIEESKGEKVNELTTDAVSEAIAEVIRCIIINPKMYPTTHYNSTLV